MRYYPGSIPGKHQFGTGGSDYISEFIFRGQGIFRLAG